MPADDPKLTGPSASRQSPHGGPGIEPQGPAPDAQTLGTAFGAVRLVRLNRDMLEILLPDEVRLATCEALPLTERQRKAVLSYARWMATGLNEMQLLDGVLVFRGDDRDATLFAMRSATLEERATYAAAVLRSPHGLPLRRAEANQIAMLLDGLLRLTQAAA